MQQSDIANDRPPVVTSIRQRTPEDAEVYARLLLENREVMDQWDAHLPDEFYTAETQRDQAKKIADKDTIFSFVVLDDGEIAGQVVVSEIRRGDSQSCELGFWIDHARWNRGNATTAVGQLLRFVFDELKLHRVTALTMPANDRSRRVLTNNGFEEVGVSKENYRIGGVWQDGVIYERLTDVPSE